MRLFVSVGEASGDAFGAEILAEMRRLAPHSDWQVEAIAGPRLRGSGVDVVADSSLWGSIGFVAASRMFFKGLAGLNRAKEALARGEPGLLLAIDCGLLNIRLARYAKSVGWKVLYFNPPGSWKRDRQGADLPEISDAIVTPFSWSAEMLNKMGAKAHWFGHPIKSMLESHKPKGSTVRETIAVLPGSRQAELKALLPVLAKALRDEPRTCEFAVAPTFAVQWLEAKWKALCPKRKDVFTQGDTYGVLSRARAGVICSGTATLEAVLCRCPMVVIYRVHPISRVELFVLRINPKRISQPNILLDEDLVPELVQMAASPSRVRTELEKLLVDGEQRDRQLRAFEEIDGMLGSDDSIRKTAELALQMMGSAPSEGGAGVVANQPNDFADNSRIL